jgi:ElaB/YqjD/DUF883 family membrane-anchored ribosome-binding protein
MMAEDLKDTDQIEADLARTRARMDSRLDQLQDHLTPKQMVNDAFAYFRGGDGADFTNDLVTRVKANPLPVALVGVGVAWLMASKHTGSPARNVAAGHDLDARIRFAEGQVVRTTDEDEDRYTARVHDARGKVLGVARDASDTAASYAQRLKDALSAGRDGARRSSHDLSQQAGNVYNRLSDTAAKSGSAFQKGTQTMAGSARDTLSSLASNPFALGAIAAVVGAVAGSLLPTLEQEEAALGATATKLRTAGRDLAQDIVDRGGRVANETLDAVKDSASAHGLTSDKPVGDVVADLKSGDLLGQVKEVAQDTLKAGQDSANKHLAGETESSQPAGNA